MWNSGMPASIAVGISGAAEMRFWPVTAKALMLPMRTCGSEFAAGSIMKSICSAIRSCMAGAAPR